jgi:hypothetical protein
LSFVTARDDIFRKIIEERRRHKDDKELYQWLKLFANFSAVLSSSTLKPCPDEKQRGSASIPEKNPTRWAGGPDPSMLADAGALYPADETCREYERVVDPKYLDQIRTQAKEFSNKLLSRQSGVARSAIMNFKNGRNTIKPRTLRKLTKAIDDLQNKKKN